MRQDYFTQQGAEASIALYLAKKFTKRMLFHDFSAIFARDMVVRCSMTGMRMSHTHTSAKVLAGVASTVNSGAFTSKTVLFDTPI